MKLFSLSKTVIVLWLSLSGLLLFGASNPADWTRAEQAYRKGDYAAAATAYQKLLKGGYQGPALEYNLGNCYYRMRELGQAVLHYERALRWSPKDEDIQRNLEIARAQLPDQIEALPEYGWLRALRNPQWILSANGWALLTGALFWLCAAGCGLWRWGARRNWRKWGFAGAITAFALAWIALTGALASHSKEKESHAAIVLQEEVNLHVAPDSRSPESRKLHEGTKVSLEDERGNWLKVQLENGDEGWLEKEGVEGI